MNELRELYQEVILDHNREPKNFFILDGATQSAEGYNPLCGDRVTVYLLMEGERIENITFQGSGCAISKASASMMTSAVKGKSIKEVQFLFHHFRNLVTGEGVPDSGALGKLAVFSGVCEFPMRVKCATLAWHTMQSAMEKKVGQVTTE